MKTYNLHEVLGSIEVMSSLPCGAEFLKGLVLEFGNPDLAKVAQYQIDMLMKGTFSVKSLRNSSVRLEVQNSVILSSKIVGYEFVDCKKIFYIFFSDISRAFPVSTVYFEDEQVCVTLNNSVWAPSEDEVMRVTARLKSQRDSSVQSKREVYAVTGDDNFAHHVWNQLGILNSLCTTNLAHTQVTVIATGEPLGRLEDLFPEVDCWRWMAMSAEELEAFNAPNRLFVVLAGSFITHSVQARIKEYANAIMTADAKWLDSVLKNDKAMWISVRGGDRTIVNQVQALAQVSITFLQKTRLHVIIDGFSVAGDTTSGRFRAKQEYNDRAAAEHLIALEIIREVADRLGHEFVKRMHVIVGWHVLDAISLLDNVAFYFCHAGTLQHKVGWFSNARGVIHSNASVLATNPSLWAAQQVEDGLISTTLPQRFVKSIEVVTGNDKRADSLKIGNYEIADLDALSIFLMDAYELSYERGLAVREASSTVRRFSILNTTRWLYNGGNIYYLDLGAITSFFTIDGNGALAGPWPSMIAIEQALGEHQFSSTFPCQNYVLPVPKPSVSLLTAFSANSASVQRVYGPTLSYEVYRINLGPRATFFVVTGHRGVLPKTFGAFEPAMSCAKAEEASDLNWRKYDVHLMYNRKLLPVKSIHRASVELMQRAIPSGEGRELVTQTGLAEVAWRLDEIDSGTAYVRVPGEIVGAEDWITQAYSDELSRSEVIPPPSRIGLLHDITLHNKCFIVTADRHVVRECLINTTSMKQFGPFKREVDGGPLSADFGSCRKWFSRVGRPVLLKQMWDNNYDHWLIESLPRLEIVATCYDLSQCCFLVGDDDDGTRKLYQDTLRLLGISDDQIVPLPDNQIIFEELIYVPPITRHPWVKAPRVISFLERLGSLVCADDLGTKRIYIQRSSHKAQLLVNEAQIEAILATYGFVTVRNLELMDFADQVRALKNASHVVGVLSVGLTNMVFAPRGAHLLVLSPAHVQDDLIWDLVTQKGGSYTALHGIAGNCETAGLGSFTIEPTLFERHLAKFDARPINN